MSAILLKGGTLIDGSGAPGFAGDLLIQDDCIAGIGSLPATAGVRVIDCTGLTIAPGFIDAHSHSDLQVLENREEKIRQGVTTEVVGNCGFSPYPAPEDRGPLYAFANGIFCGDEDWGWPSAAAYLADVAQRGKVHAISLVGHGTLRVAQAGHRLGPLTERELDAMEGMLADALSQGACGLSTGLMYSPGSSAPFEELERLCRVVARHGKVHATHMRDYGTHLLQAVDEQLELARRTGCRLQISHFQAVGPRNWPKQAIALEKIEKARDEGVDVAFDCYPYTAGSTVMTQLLPQSALDGGVEAMLSRLGDRATRARITSEICERIEQSWSDIHICAVSSAENQSAVGRSLAELAEARGREPVDAMLDLLIEERGEVNIVSFNQSEENLRQTLSHPLSNIISDGFYVRGRPHPRLYGTFPLLLGEICRRRRWMDLPQAIHKITGRPAQRFDIRQRGRLERGWFADITVFDAGVVDSAASYENPEVEPVGIRYVFRNGKMIAEAKRGSEVIVSL